MASISERENREIEAANASGNTPVVFIHGLWLLPSSWANWVDFFKRAGYAPLTPDWPDDPATVEEARANPDVLAKKTLKQVADHTTEIINALDKKPVVLGHSTGGLLAEMLAGRGLSAATVAIDPGVFRGVLPLPASVLKGVGPFLVNPLTRGRAITLTFDQFKYGWANALDENEAKELYDTFHVAGSGIALAQMGNANINPWTESKVNTKNPDRGPLLIIDGEKDHTVPWAIANAAYKRQRHNPAVTEIVKIPNRGHTLLLEPSAIAGCQLRGREWVQQPVVLTVDEVQRAAVQPGDEQPPGGQRVVDLGRGTPTERLRTARRAPRDPAPGRQGAVA